MALDMINFCYYFLCLKIILHLLVTVVYLPIRRRIVNCVEKLSSHLCLWIFILILLITVKSV